MEGDNVFANGCLIVSKFRFWGASRQLSEDQLGNLPSKIVKATRSLIRDKSKLQAVNGIKDEAKRFIKIYSLYYPIDGIDFIPKDNIEIVNKGLEYRKTLAGEGVEALINQLESLKADYRREYPDYYNEENYPTPAQLRANFVFRWSFRVFGLPDEGLKIISPQMYKTEVEKFQNEMQEMKDGLVSIVAKEFYQRIEKLKDQCLSGDISSATVTSIDNTLEKFDKVWKGYVAHDELQNAIKSIREFMKGTKADMLKVDDEFREAIGDGMSAIVDQLKNSSDPILTRKLDM